MFPDLKIAAFETCLQRVLSGENLERVLAEYPAWVEELRPMLEAALLAHAAGYQPRVPKAALARNRARFLRAARSLQQQKPARSLLPAFPAARLALAALSILVLLILSGAVTVTLAARALPGEPLYNLKLIGEQTQLRFTTDPVRRLELQQTFDNKRLEEVGQLIQQERAMPVSFVGALHVIGENGWHVGDVTVHLNAQTSLEGDLQIGLNVGVEGDLQPDGSVIASRIWDRAFVFTGELMGISGEIWHVSGVDILILPETRIEGLPALGSRLQMLLVQRADEQWFARVVNVTARGASPPTVTSLPVFEPSPTRPLPTATLQERVEPSSTPQPSHTPEPTETRDQDDDDDGREQPSETPENTRTPRPTRTPEPTEEEDDDPTDTPIGLASPTQTPTPTPTSTRRPTRTPEPTEEED